MADRMIVYGARCIWWDDISKTSRTTPRLGGHALPCCPSCGSVLFEMAPMVFWKSVDEVEKDRAGYRAFVEWLRGKCFKTFADALEAYTKDTGNKVAGSRSVLKSSTA